MKKLWLLAAILILALFVTACNGGDTTSEDPAENNVEENNNEATDPSPTTGSGLSSLEAVEAITAQWAAGGHANTGNPLNYAGGRDGCQPCHSENGFLQALTDNPYTPEADAEAEEEVHAQQAMGCATCHTGLGKDLLDSDVAMAELVPFANEDFEAKGSALCISCHNGRRDTVDMYDQWASGEGKPAAYPHYDAGALASGKGGMEYPDVTYASTGAHVNIGCVGCHMPETDDGYVSHDFNMEIAYIDQTCGTCHGGATDFAVGGNVQAEIDELLEELHELAVAAVDGADVVGTGRLTFPFAKLLEDGTEEAVDLEHVSKEAFVGAYNYYLINADKSGGAHNPAYAKSLLQESINALK